jgi:hypothetical protein
MADKNAFRYDRMVQEALRTVVRQALQYAAEHGLPGAHHFYVTFRTDYPGVDIPGFLSAQYPKDMTIVLEHQFWGLEVDDEKFGVTLSFRGQSQRLTIPLLAIRAFVDPSVKFGLEFPGEEDEQNQVTPQPGSLISMAESAPDRPIEAGSAEGGHAMQEKAGEVVKLDAFRKK